jgi:ABC-type glutathione transport system ATPase component
MKIEVQNRTDDFNSYRAQRVKSLFNVGGGNEFKITADIPMDSDDWSIGLIVGASGSGKTSIGRNLFGGGRIVNLYDGWDTNRPIVDCIAPDGDFDTVTGSLASVGLGDVPSWLKPFNALSNGQQFRAGLARLLVDADDGVIVDEFTSVIDRQIAKIGAMAFGKGWRRNKGKRVILISCHYDIIEWLRPDWVYDTGTQTLKKAGRSGEDLNLISKFGRSTNLTGDILSHIII